MVLESEISVTCINFFCEGQSPGSRYGLSLTHVKPNLVLFGGNNSQVPLNDVWILNLEQRPSIWKKVEVTGALKPDPRAYHSAALFVQNRATSTIAIFGGRSQYKRAMKDTWGLRSHSDGRWDWVKAPYDKESEQPSSRYQHSLFFFGTLMFVYGGRGDSPNKQLNLDVYQSDTSKWFKYKCEQRFRHGTWFFDSDLYVFAGFSPPNVNEPVSSLIKIDLALLLTDNSDFLKIIIEHLITLNS